MKSYIRKIYDKRQKIKKDDNMTKNQAKRGRGETQTPEKRQQQKIQRDLTKKNFKQKTEKSVAF